MGCSGVIFEVRFCEAGFDMDKLLFSNVFLPWQNVGVYVSL